MNGNGKNTLLPSGFHDVLPDIAARESRVIARLLKRFAQFGYRQVKPPMAEFEETLLSGSTRDLAEQTFRFLDPLSRKMLGLRADMTPQVARLAALRLKDQVRPLRLSYAGQVLRVRGEGLYAERQLAQAGIELIGSDGPAADSEVVNVSLEALKAIGLTGMTLDFSLPHLSTRIMEAHNLLPPARENILAMIEKKDMAGIEKAAGTSASLITALIAASGPAKKAIDTLGRLFLPDALQHDVKRLAAVVELSASPITTITIDPLERRGFEYHTGISFSLFSARGEEIGRGGRYVISGTNEAAAGFTLSINAILRALPEKYEGDIIFIPYGTPSEQGILLREQGRYTLQGLEKVKNNVSEAKRLGCTHILQEGKIVSI